MATQHYNIQRSTNGGSKLMKVLDDLADKWNELRQLRGSMIAAKGDSSEWGAIATLYGYDDATAAQAGFGEIDSAYGNGNASIQQMLDRHIL